MTTTSAKDKAAADAPLAVDAEEEELVDFSVVRKYEPIPADEPYVATITKWVRNKSAAGNAQIEVQVETQKCRLGGEEHLEKYVAGRYSLLPQSLFSLFGFLTSLGYDPEELKKKAPSLAAENYLGLSIVIFARDNTYNEITTSQIRRTLSAEKWDDILAGKEAEPEGDEGDTPNM